MQAVTFPSCHANFKVHHPSRPFDEQLPSALQRIRTWMRQNPCTSRTLKACSSWSLASSCFRSSWMSSRNICKTLRALSDSFEDIDAFSCVLLTRLTKLAMLTQTQTVHATRAQFQPICRLCYAGCEWEARHRRQLGGYLCALPGG